MKMKIVKKIYNSKNTILIYKKKNKKYVDKIFTHKNISYFKKEILGNKYFKKKNYFNIPKIYSHTVKNNSARITLEFIDGKKARIYDLKSIYKLAPLISKKVDIYKYLNELMRNYMIKKDKFIPKYLINIFYLKKKICVSKTHGDFVNYNCIKKNKKFYIFDFEKFRERIVIYDYLNWIIHPISFNLSKFFFLNNKSLLIRNLNKILSFILYVVVKNLTKKFFLKLKIKPNDFDLYYFLFLCEKILIIREDLPYVKNKKIRSDASKHLIYLKYLYYNFSKVIKKNYLKEIKFTKLKLISNHEKF